MPRLVTARTWGQLIMACVPKKMSMIKIHATAPARGFRQASSAAGNAITGIRNNAKSIGAEKPNTIKPPINRQDSHAAMTRLISKDKFRSCATEMSGIRNSRAGAEDCTKNRSVRLALFSLLYTMLPFCSQKGCWWSISRWPG